MSFRSETRDMVNLVGGNLLNNLFESIEKQFNMVIQIEKDISFRYVTIQLRLKFLEENIPKIHQLVALLAGNKKTRENLAYCTNKIIETIRDPYFYEPLYQTRMTRLMTSLTNAIEGNFGRKEDIQLKAILLILSKVSVLKESILVPKRFEEKFDELEEELD